MALEADVGNIINLKIARRLDEVAQILTEQGANPYRVQAYQNAAVNLARAVARQASSSVIGRYSPSEGVK